MAAIWTGPDGSTELPRILLLDSAIRPYAWGSPTAIPALLGVPPTGGPAAELWMGAHPDEPSHWASHPDRPALDALIAAAPEQLLGTRNVERFGPHLPFLLKLLAADKCLSIQVHPNVQQAQVGFAGEEELGVPRSSPARNYSDPNHKPELLCALTEFEALCGFRPVAATLDYFDALIGVGVKQLAPYRDLIEATDGLRAAFTTLITLPDPARTELIDAVVGGCRTLADAGGPWSGAARASVLAGTDFPGDIGAVLALLLNYVRLEPGQAIYLAAGNVHAYLRGFGVEILANSNNVLRCGLTEKHVDVPELLRIADFQALADPLSPVSVVSSAESVYPVPVPDFQLSVLEPCAGEVVLPGDRPHVLVVTRGSVAVSDFAVSDVAVSGVAVSDFALSGVGERVEVAQGLAVFISAGVAPVRVTGTGTAFVATTGTLPR
jgi:mannose-6-phosphate isomerase